MTIQTPATPLHRAFLEWREAYENRAYLLARLEMQNATESHPNAPEAWFLMGMAELAARDVQRAKSSFEKALQLIQKRAAITLSVPEFTRLHAVLPLLIEGIDKKIVTSAPTDWLCWLREPQLIQSTAVSLAAKAHQPLGRVEPLLPVDKQRPAGALVGGVLSSELKIEKLKVDTMAELLGRDANIKVNRDPITIQETIVINRETRETAPKPPPSREMRQEPRRTAPARPAARQPSREAPAAPAATPFTFAPAPTARPAAPAPVAQAPVVVQPQPEPAAKPHVTDAWSKWEEEVRELLARGREKEALSRAEDAIQRYPESSRLLELKAELLEQAGRRFDAAKAYALTYDKASRTGADDRARRAFNNAVELARENGDLLLDLAAMAAAVGATSMAATAAGVAIDLYRRRDDRPKLAEALQKMLAIDPGNVTLQHEFSRVRGELEQLAVGKGRQLVANNPRAAELTQLARQLDSVARESKSDTIEIHGGEAEPFQTTYERTRPPAQRPSNPVTTSRPPTIRPAPAYDQRRAIKGSQEFGVWLAIGSFVLLFLSAGIGPVPAIIGFIVTNIYINVQKAQGGGGGLMLANVARVLFVLGVLIGLGTSLFR